MSMFPAFIVGAIVGAWVTVTYYTCRKEIPSNTKIHTLEHYIEDLKEDIALLETDNTRLRDELESLKENKKIGG